MRSWTKPHPSRWGRHASVVWCGRRRSGFRRSSWAPRPHADFLCARHDSAMVWALGRWVISGHQGDWPAAAALWWDPVGQGKVSAPCTTPQVGVVTRASARSWLAKLAFCWAISLQGGSLVSPLRVGSCCRDLQGVLLWWRRRILGEHTIAARRPRARASLAQPGPGQQPWPPLAASATRGPVGFRQPLRSLGRRT